MKTIPLKILLVSAGIFILSGCYTQLSEPISRTEYFSEPDTVYEYQEYDLSDYNEGYRDGFRDFANQYLWYGYNPNSFLYYIYHPYWDSPWSYRHSAYLGYYDPFYYDPFWDWGYYGYYSPYSYYSYTGWYYSPYYYRHRYYHRYPYYYGVYFSGRKVSEGREQLTADRQPISGSGAAARANRTSVDNTSAYNNPMNLQMTSGGSSSSGASNSSASPTKSFPEGVSKPNISSKEIQTIDKKPQKSSAETIPGFQNTLTRPSHPEVKPIRGSSKYQPSTETKRTIPSKRSSDSRRIYKPRTPAKSSTSEAKSVSRPSSRSGLSSKSSYSAPSRKSSNSSSSSSRSSVRSSSSRRSSGSSSKSSSSRSSSSRKSSSRSSSKKK